MKYFGIVAIIAFSSFLVGNTSKLYIDNGVDFAVLNMENPDSLDHPFLSIRVNSEDGHGMYLEQNGRCVIGTLDPCLTDIPEDVRLYIDGNVLKTGAPFVFGESDRRLKKNIAPLAKSKDKFMDLNFYSYEYKQTGSLRYGIMAQEVKEDFPNSVKTFERNGEEYLAFNPNNLFFTGMKVIQENRKEITEQDEQIRTLQAENQALRAELEAEHKQNNQQEARLQAIEAALANQGVDIPKPVRTETHPKPVSSNIQISIENGIAGLQQNVPNPFSQSTIIPYYLPEGTRSATLLIRDMMGKTIAKHILPTQKGAGKINVDIEDTQLQGGTFTYSLYINETLIGTKKMVLLAR